MDRRLGEGNENMPAVDGVSAEGLSKYFSDRRKGVVRAVDDLSFQARAGEVFGLLGVNGAGKTTTLRLLATLLRPTSGQATVNGFSLAGQPEQVRRSIGFLSTTTALYGRLTPREVAFYFGRLHGLERPQIEKRLEDLVRVLDIGAFLDRRCDKLSSGTRQKVSIVRALLHDPPVMILDEPTAGLDVLASRSVVWLIEESRRRGKCVIFSSHNMAEVEKLCDRVGVIHRGRLLECRAKQELLAGGERMDEVFLRLVGEAG